MKEPRTLPRDQLIPWPGLNPRRTFEAPDLQELRESLEADGMLQPVGVTLQEEPPHFIYAGERRWRAAEGVLEELPVIIRDIDEATARRLALTENIQRSALTAVEEAEGIERYLEASGSTQGELAEELGKSQSWISNRLRLLRLPDSIREIIQEGRLSASQARDLILPFSKLDAWEELAGKVAEDLEEFQGPLDDEVVRSTVSGVAVPMSGWMDRKIHAHEDVIDGLDSFLTLPPEVWKTAPKKALVEYDYGPYHGGWRSTRCFDPEWWLHAMTKEQRRRDQEAKKRKSTFEETGGAYGPDLDWHPDKGPIPSDKHVPDVQRHVVFHTSPTNHRPYWDPLLPIGNLRGEENAELYDETWSVLVDPANIPASCLVLHEGAKYRQPAVLCTKADVWAEAEEALTLRRDRLYEERIRKIAEKDLERASSVSMKDLRAILALAEMKTVEGSIIEDLAGELGLELPERGEAPEEHWRKSWAERGAIRAYHEFQWLQQIPPGQLENLVALAVERLTDRRAAWKPREGYGLAAAEQVRRSVNFELRQLYRRDLERKKLPFELPTYQDPNQETDDAESV